MARGEAEAVEEFLKKLASDQDRMRKHIQGQGLRFRKMGAAVNRTLASKGRIFLLGEDILEDVARIIGEEYFRLWPVVSLSLSRPENNDLSSIERDEASVAEGLPEHVVDMARRFHSGDAVLAFVHQGRSRALCALLEEAKRRGVSVLVIGGLDARGRRVLEHAPHELDEEPVVFWSVPGLAAPSSSRTARVGADDVRQAPRLAHGLVPLPWFCF